MLEAVDRRVTSIIRLKNGIQLGDIQQILDELGWTCQFEVATVLLVGCQGVDQNSQAAAVHSLNAAEINNHFQPVIVQQAVDLIVQFNSLRAAQHITVKFENDHVVVRRFTEIHIGTTGYFLLTATADDFLLSHSTNIGDAMKIDE